MQELNSMEDFQRDVTYRVHKREDGAIALTATLKDRFQDILVEIIVDGATLTIGSARSEFRKSPTSDCPAVSARLELLNGFSIGKGLSRKLTEVLGGREGCGNLRTLLLGLLPLAINVRASAGYRDEQEMLDAIHEQLAGTCGGYVRPLNREEDRKRAPDKLRKINLKIS
jgi:hypothetical protein